MDAIHYHEQEAHKAVDGVVLDAVIQDVQAELTPVVSTETLHGITTGTGWSYANIYRAFMQARKAAEVLPINALSTFKGWTATEDHDDKFMRKAYHWYEREVYEKLLESCVKGRIYGDCFFFPMFYDGNSLDTPLDLSKVTEFWGCVVKRREWVNPVGPTSATRANAEWYSVSLTGDDLVTFARNIDEEKLKELVGFTITGGSVVKVHRSRIFYMPGLIDHASESTDQGGDLSVYRYCKKGLQEWEESRKHGMKMLATHSAYIMKIDGLASKTVMNKVKDLSARLSSTMKALTTFGGLLVDKNKEDAAIVNRTYTNVDAVINVIATGLKNGLDVPASYIMGDAESPYSEAGAGDRYDMAKLIDQYYLSHLNHVLEHLFMGFSAVQKQVKFLDPLEFCLDRESSLMLTRKEESEVRFKNAQTDSLYMIPSDPTDPTSAVLLTEDIRTRFERGRYSDDITLIEGIDRVRDFAKLKKLTDARLDTAIKMENNPQPVQQGAKGSSSSAGKGGGQNKAARMITGNQGRSAYNGQDVK